VAGIISSTGAAQQGSLPPALEYGIPHFEVTSGSYWDEFIDPADYPPGQTNYAFSPRALCKEEAVLTADFIASKPEWSTVVLMRGTKAHDRMHTETIRERLGILSDPTDPDNPRASDPWMGEVVNAEDVVMEYQEENPESWIPWRDHLRAVARDYPAAVMFFHLRGDSNNFSFLEAAKDVSYVPDIVTCGMARKSSLLDAVNPGIVDYLAGNLYFVTRGPVQGEHYDSFVAALEEFSGYSPDFWAASAYDAAAMLGLAVATVGSTSREAIRDAIVDVSRDGAPVDYRNMGQALSMAHSGADLNYEGASGPADFRDDRSIPGRFWVDEIQYSTGAEAGSYNPLAGWDRSDI
jgi:hypothetical protein